MSQENLIHWIMLITVITLAIICLSTVAALLIGLYDNKVDNEQIFRIITPAFNTVVGAFVGLLGGLSLGSKGKK